MASRPVWVVFDTLANGHEPGHPDMTATISLSPDSIPGAQRYTRLNIDKETIEVMGKPLGRLPALVHGHDRSFPWNVRQHSTTYGIELNMGSSTMRSFKLGISFVTDIEIVNP